MFSPANVKNLSLYISNAVTSNLSAQKQATFRSAKVLVKQSYLMMAWLRLFSNSKKKVISFSFLPKKNTKYTLTKAPMAHKTFSQEQFSITYRTIAVSICRNYDMYDGLHATMMLINNFHLNKLNIGTNLMFLSKIKYTVLSSSSKFLTLK